MIETYVRPLYQKVLVDPVAVPLKSVLSPNTVTALSGVFGVLVAPVLLWGEPWAAFLFLMMSGYLDTLDGTLARLQNKSTPLGTVFDIFSDRVVECAVILGLCLISSETRGPFSLLMLGSVLLCVTAFLVVGIFTENMSNKGFFYSRGLMERPEAFVFFALMIFLPQYFQPLALTFSALVFFTAVVHIYRFVKFCEEEE